MSGRRTRSPRAARRDYFRLDPAAVDPEETLNIRGSYRSHLSSRSIFEAFPVIELWNKQIRKHCFDYPFWDRL
jgi:hypothetical protein